MLDCEKVLPYNDKEKKSQQVSRMFNAIAEKYDFFNHAMSFGLDFLWRHKAIKSLKKSHPKTMLDVATGTGDFALKAYSMLRPDEIIGIDISVEMMRVGAQKVQKKGLQDKISFSEQNCERLTFADNTFDAVTVSFGVRNFEHLEVAFCEVCRVLKPGGEFVILELSEPDNWLVRWGYKIHSFVFIPLFGKLFSNDAKAYKYLPKSIAAFPKGEKMKSRLISCGFSDIEYRKFTFGVCSFYKCKKKDIEARIENHRPNGK